MRRSRLILPAAIAAAATYIALVKDDARRRPPRPDAQSTSAPEPPTAPRPTWPARDPAPVEAIGARQTSEHAIPADADQGATTPPVEPVDRHVSDPTSPESGPGDLQPPASTEGAVLDEGTFSIGGWAAAPGHSAVSAVTFHTRLAVPVPADRIALSIDSSENIPAGGLMVLADPGFAPDRDGFTLLLAAEAPGPFSATGTYRAIG